MPDQLSALEMGRRSATMGDTEAGPGYLDQLLARMRELATISPSPTGDRLENARQLIGYALPETPTLVRTLLSRLPGLQTAERPAAAVAPMRPVRPMPAAETVPRWSARDAAWVPTVEPAPLGHAVSMNAPVREFNVEGMANPRPGEAMTPSQTIDVSGPQFVMPRNINDVPDARSLQMLRAKTGAAR